MFLLTDMRDRPLEGRNIVVREEKLRSGIRAHRSTSKAQKYLTNSIQTSRRIPRLLSFIPYEAWIETGRESLESYDFCDEQPRAGLYEVSDLHRNVHQSNPNFGEAGIDRNPSNFRNVAHRFNGQTVNGGKNSLLPVGACKQSPTFFRGNFPKTWRHAVMFYKIDMTGAAIF